eukprot:691187_1
MYFSSNPRLMFLVTFMVLLISKSAIGSEVKTDCTRTSLNNILVKSGNFLPVNDYKETYLEFHSEKTPDTNAKATVNKSEMNGYFAQCEDSAQIPFANGKFVALYNYTRYFQVFCSDIKDDTPSWSVMNPDSKSLGNGWDKCDNDVRGAPLADVQCIDGITAITDGENVTFSNIPPIFTGVDFRKDRDFIGSDAVFPSPIEKRVIDRDNTVVVSAKLLTTSGQVVSPETQIEMTLYEGLDLKSFQTQSVEVEAAPGYTYAALDSDSMFQAIKAITDGENVTFSNIPSMFTGIDFQKNIDSDFKSDAVNLWIEERDIDNTVMVSAKSLTTSGNVVVPFREIEMKLYEGPDPNSFQEKSVIVKPAQGYVYDPPTPPPEFLGEYTWIIVLAIIVIFAAIGHFANNGENRKKSIAEF